MKNEFEFQIHKLNLDNFKLTLNSVWWTVLNVLNCIYKLSVKIKNISIKNMIWIVMKCIKTKNLTEFIIQIESNDIESQMKKIYFQIPFIWSSISETQSVLYSSCNNVILLIKYWEKSMPYFLENPLQFFDLLLGL